MDSVVIQLYNHIYIHTLVQSNLCYEYESTRSQSEGLSSPRLLDGTQLTLDPSRRNNIALQLKTH